MSSTLLQQALSRHQAGHLSEAIPLYRQLLTAEPDNALVLRQLGVIAFQTNRHHEAIDYLKRAVQLQADNQEWYCDLGTVYRAANQHTEALACFQQALDIGPPQARIHASLGQALIDLNELESAVTHLRTALQLDKTYASAWFNLGMLANSGEYNFSKVDLGLIESLLNDPEAANQEQRVLLHFTFADCMHRQQSYEQAWQHYQMANDLKSATMPAFRQFDAAAYSRSVDEIINTFTLELVQRLQVTKTNGTEPLFIVGMPRSGTTLLEQILTTHTQIQTRGEINYISKLAIDTLPEFCDSEIFPRFLDKLTVEHLDKASQLYRQWSEAQQSTAVWLIDKMPMNFLYTGLLFLLFPNCRVIDVRRDPVAVCWSAYCQNLKDTWTNSFAGLASYYADYVRLSEHWLSLFADRIYTLQYEELVNEQEAQVKAVLDYLGLQWQQQLLDHQNNSAMIKTTSKLQARKPVYDNANERWKHYRPYIDELVDKLM